MRHGGTPHKPESLAALEAAALPALLHMSSFHVHTFANFVPEAQKRRQTGLFGQASPSASSPVIRDLRRLEKCVSD